MEIERDGSRADEGEKLLDFEAMSSILVGDAGTDWDLSITFSFLFRPALFAF